MYIEILKYGFLIIFLTTALVGILSLPGWLKIDEWYKKKIFVALILEVVGAIIILFKQEIVNTDINKNTEISINNNEWIALNEKGLIVKPEVNVKFQDTIISKNYGKQSYIEFKDLNCVINESGLSIINADSVSLGTLKTKDLKKNGIFNSFDNAEDGQILSNNYKTIKLVKDSLAKWSQNGTYIGPFKVNIYYSARGLEYKILNITNGETVFNSSDHSGRLFDTDQRIMHFLKHENDFYLLRITEANLQSTNQFIHILNMKIKPTFKLD